MAELDFSETADGELAAVHDWGRWHESAGSRSAGTAIPSLYAFHRIGRLDGQQTLDFKTAQDWLAQDPAAVLITDKTENVSYMAAHAVDKRRVMPELFSFETYTEALKAGFTRAMLSWQRMEGRVDEATFLRFVEDWQVKRVAMPTSKALRSDLALRLRERGTCVFAYTSNSPQEMKQALEKGAYGFYTDDRAPQGGATTDQP
jgi:glycerophosphoryl diester phosphodiesterase